MPKRRQTHPRLVPFLPCSCHIYFTQELYLGPRIKIYRSQITDLNHQHFNILNGILEMAAKFYYFYDSRLITQEAWRLKSLHVLGESICVSGKLRKGKDTGGISMKPPFLTATLTWGQGENYNFDIPFKCPAEICKHVR